MTYQQIRESFNMIKTQNTSQYCQGLNKILTFIKSNTITEVTQNGISIDGGAKIFNNFELESAYRRKFPENNVPSVSDMQKELEIAEGVLITFKIDTGTYSFCVPINNEFYYEVCKALNIPFEKIGVQKEVIHKFITYPTLCENIKTAIKFVSTDDFRPAMECVMLQFTSEGVNVVGTDAHILYESKYIPFEGTTKDIKILISPYGLNVLKTMKIDHDNPLNIQLFADDTMSINDIEIATMTGVLFPDYKALMNKDGVMEFDKDILIQKVKYVLPCANKVTNQVLLHLNEAIDLHTQDVDFEFEANATMPYISKDFKDMDISFNGKKLIKCLSVLKGKKIKMYSTGKSESPVLLTNDTDTMLLMPYLNK